jgi:hypothetical protein
LQVAIGRVAQRGAQVGVALAVGGSVGCSAHGR